MTTNQFEKLRNLKISTDTQAFSKAIAECPKESISDMLHVISLANDNEDLFKLQMGNLINRIVSFRSEATSELSKHFSAILNSIKDLQNPIPMFFLLLEHSTHKKDEVSRLKLLEILSCLEFSVVNVIDLLYKENTDLVILEILKIKVDLIDDFIRNSIKIENILVSKNLGLILSRLDPKLFLNYRSFLVLFESESHYTRNCLLDILQRLVFSFKENGNIEAIKEITEIIIERLGDVNLYVRSRALSVISELFVNECVLKDQRNSIIKDSMDRIRDKTVLVRKKSINLLSQILLNHPFKDRKSLQREDNTDGNTHKSSRNLNDRMNEDFNDFVSLMESSLKSIVSLLECDLKTDLIEISSFIKIAYLFKLQGSKEAIQKMLGLVFTKDKQIIIDVFMEILTNRSEILYEFINDRAFEVILSNLDIDDGPLFKNVFNDVKLFETVYILKQCKKPITESIGSPLLQHITETLFKSKDESELQENLKCYSNTLCILKRMKHRIEYNHEIFTLISKNVIKMVFYHKTVIKHTVELIYCISSNPEKTVGKFLKNLYLSKSCLKVVDSCGCVALNQFYLLERLEKSMKSTNSEARNSLGSSNSVRKSLENLKSIDNLREKRKSLEEIRNSRKSSISRLSLESNDLNRLSLNFDELSETLKSKTEEEISDFFFYLKEKEILYSKTSMLHQIVPVMLQSLESTNLEVQCVAYSSLFKCMMISSDFFNEHKDKLLYALSHPSYKVKNIAIVAMHDFLIFYNTSLDPSLLFDKLNDKEVSKNALLVIFNLLQKNIIRIRNNSISLINLLFNEELGIIVKALIKNFASNSNLISVLFYESFNSDLSTEYVKFLSSYIPLNIQESMFLKCLKTDANIERLKCVFDSFELNEKFIKENMFREQMKMIVSEFEEK